MSSQEGHRSPDGEARKGGRREVSSEVLLDLLNQRLAAYGHCHACHFVGPIRQLPEPLEDGRNWSRYVALVCSESVGSGCKRAAERILDDAALEYNLSVA